MKSKLKLTPVEPDWEGMTGNLRRRGTPKRVFYFEHGIADNIKESLCEIAGIPGLPAAARKEDEWRRTMELHRFMGHELFRVFPKGGRFEAPLKTGAWVDESRGPVSTWAEFETFPWPDPKAADLSVLDWLDKNIHANQRAFHVFDIWESAKNLIGFETLCFALNDDPAFANAVFQRIGEFSVAIAEAVCDYDAYGAVYVADDLGFKTSLLMDPGKMRELVMPWHRRISEIAHSHGKLFLFHSCGDMYPLMDEYIDDIKIDAKHSFEDNVKPVTEVKKAYGNRMTLLGGMDVDYLSRAEEKSIRSRTREILSACVPGGGYFLGSGNWVTDYIPIDNYLCMLDEARHFQCAS